jgi:L-serine dehydratase
MKDISILNDVLGPVMRGPSSSHTAGSWHLARLARSLLGERPVKARFLFDKDGSYGKVHFEQGSDFAFASGLLGWPITDERFPRALELAPVEGLKASFITGEIPGADHPNDVAIELCGELGARLSLRGRSVGGGAVELRFLEGWPVMITGSTWVVAVEVETAANGGMDTANQAAACLAQDGAVLEEVEISRNGGLALVLARRKEQLPATIKTRLSGLVGYRRSWEVAPLNFVKRGHAPFSSFAEMSSVKRAGLLGLAYETALLCIPETELLVEMAKRLDLMIASVARGLDLGLPAMQLLDPSAGQVLASEKAGKAAFGGLHTRAAVRAMAALHVNCGMGVVCAAPTAGSAGVIPGVMATLVEELGIAREKAVECLFAAGLVGALIAERATFAAEVAGCQVEIGAAGAMAAAAVVEAAGGSAAQAADAAAVCLQNTMGSVCDLVQGVVEIPCHTRNAVAASSAFVVADLVMGGYRNPIPLDETIDAMLSVGRMMPPELRVTSLGGLAVTPSALAMPKRSWGGPA